MKIAQKYSHLNGEEYLLVHHKELYQQIIDVIESIDAEDYLTKISKEKTKVGDILFSPTGLNDAFRNEFNDRGWGESRYKYYISTNRDHLSQLISLGYDEQKRYLQSQGIESPLHSYKQTDFVRDMVAVEVQFGKYAFVAFDLFVKHLLFYSGGKINIGVEILPTKKMQEKMSSGVAYYEGEVYNILRQGRNTPAVPLLILGIEQE